ncbi:hypothetical protein FD755_014559 [Muntiacus reevesi]|uniref:Translationally-controlled tumor protein n=1 Tax=Muntiacus reevesi TaxID=9886 RepID=A0A5N3XKZ2_MUNRE|nr:hypothetical protein FD755_014559 [Muntiacus reevesi]
MTIYQDLISHDEMFSRHLQDLGSRGQAVPGGVGKMVSRTEGNIDDSLIGGNASAEGPEGNETKSTVSNHSYKKAIKDYMKSIKGKFEEQRPEGVKPFMTKTAEQIKHILSDFKHYQFFIDENDPDGRVALMNYPGDAVTP